MHYPLRRFTLLFSALSLIVFSTSMAACSGKTSRAAQAYRMASLEQMPSEVRSAAVDVQEAYQFALANPEILGQIPCYCGCGGMGHTSNYACYASGVDAEDRPIFDGHALGCSICVDITQDTMRLLDEDRSVSEIRAYVDETYSQYGPSNIP